MNKSRFLAVVCAYVLLIAMPITASAVTIQVDVVDSSTIKLTFSGTINGPEPGDLLGNLFIDTPVPSAISSNATSITGDAMLGSLPLHSVFSGYNNLPYGGSLQLRGSINGVTPLAIGDILSGAATISFNVPHGMTQGMFDGIGVPIYWGNTVGTLQGYAQTVVPIPAAVWLFGSGLLGLVGMARRKKA